MGACSPRPRLPFRMCVVTFWQSRRPQRRHFLGLHAPQTPFLGSFHPHFPLWVNAPMVRKVVAARKAVRQAWDVVGLEC